MGGNAKRPLSRLWNKEKLRNSQIAETLKHYSGIPVLRCQCQDLDKNWNFGPEFARTRNRAAIFGRCILKLAHLEPRGIRRWQLFIKLSTGLYLHGGQKSTTLLSNNGKWRWEMLTNQCTQKSWPKIRMSFLNSDTWNLCGLATSLIAPLIPASSKILFWDLLRSLSNAKLLLRSTHFPEAALPITMAKYDDHDWDEVRTSVAPRCCWSHISCSDLSLPPSRYISFSSQQRHKKPQKY